jgi:hypothetical protein
MLSIEKLHVTSADHAITIARWDDDGGAPRHSPSDVDAARDERAMRRRCRAVPAAAWEEWTFEALDRFSRAGEGPGANPSLL